MIATAALAISAACSAAPPSLVISRPPGTVVRCIEGTPIRPIPTPERRWLASFGCAGIGILYGTWPTTARRGQTVTLTVHLDSLSQRELSLRYAAELRLERVGADDLVVARTELLPAHVPPAADDERTLDLPIPGDLQPGAYRFLLATGFVFSTSAGYDPFAVGGSVTIQ